MCDLCDSYHGNGGVNRREFIKITGAAGAATVLGGFRSIGALAQDAACDAAACGTAACQPLQKKRTRVAVVFLQPPADDGAAESEANLAARENFRRKLDAIGATYSLDFDYRGVLRTQAQAAACIDGINVAPPDTLLIVDFSDSSNSSDFSNSSDSSDSLSRQVFEMTQKMPLPMSAIVCQPAPGSPRQQSSAAATATAPAGVVYIHSLEDWEGLESALAAANAKKIMAQSRLLCIANINEPTAATDKNLGVDIVAFPPSEYSAVFDSIKADDSLVRDAMAFKKKAAANLGVEDRYFVDGFRGHKTVLELMKRHGADAITIFCLHLRERRPCISFSLNNSAGIPCACEDDRGAAMTMMIGSRLFQRGGFQHNQKFYTGRNQYGGCHCTCPLEMRGPGNGELPFRVKPYPHQPPPSIAFDVRMPSGEKAFITKYVPKDSHVFAYTGMVKGPTPPELKAPNDCETGFVMDIDKTGDVATIYHAPHPILYFGGAAEARRMEMFAALARMKFTGNI